MEEIIKTLINIKEAKTTGFYFDIGIIDNRAHNGTHKIILKFCSSRLSFEKEYSFPLHKGNFENGDFNAWFENVIQDVEETENKA